MPPPLWPTPQFCLLCHTHIHPSQTFKAHPANIRTGHMEQWAKIMIQTTDNLFSQERVKHLHYLMVLSMFYPLVQCPDDLTRPDPVTCHEAGQVTGTFLWWHNKIISDPASPHLTITPFTGRTTRVAWHQLDAALTSLSDEKSWAQINGHSQGPLSLIYTPGLHVSIALLLILLRLSRPGSLYAGLVT